MEAALTFHIPQSTVDARDGKVMIDGLVVEDRTLADLVRRRLEQHVSAEGTVTDALEIGARVLDREATGAEVDMVTREFERVSGEVERAFTDKARIVAEHMQAQFEKFLGEDTGAVAKVLDEHAGGLEELIAKNFGGDRSTAVQHQLREQMAKALQESQAALLRQFSAEDGHNPLADFKGAVVRELREARGKDDALIEKVTELKGEIARLRDAEESRDELEAEREKGTAKGRTFEEQAFEVLDELANHRGDAALRVGDERSATGGKLGDVVIELDAAQGESRGRIAFEVKDEKLSKNRAWEVLNGTLKERDATFAILVVAADEKVPSGREALHEYEGNKMIVTLDRESLDPRPLELAYRYARCRCLMTLERTLQVDAAGVRDATEEALSALRDAQKIRASLTGAKKNVEGAHGALDVMVARVEASLARVETLIASAP